MADNFGVTQYVHDVELTSFGDITGGVNAGGISINGKTIVRTKWVVFGPDRGFNIFEFDVKLGVTTKNFRFDTCVSTDQASALAYYLDRLPRGTVLLAVTANDAYQSLEPAKTALLSIGVNVSELRFRGSLAFIARTGFPDRTLVKVRGNSGEPSQLKAKIKYVPSTNDVTFKLIS